MTFKIIDVNDEFITEMDKYRQPNKEAGLIQASKENVVVFAERMLGMRPDGMVAPKDKEHKGHKLGHIYAWQVYALTKVQEAIKARRERQIQVEVDDDSIKVTVDSREYVILTSRQVGKSVLLAIIGAWACVFNELPCGAADATAVIIISASDVQAKKLLYEIKKFLRMGDRFLRDTYRDADDKPLFGDSFFTNLLDDTEANNTTTITFEPHDQSKHGDILLNGSRSGSTIKSYAPTAVVLGETGSLLIEDEAGMTDRITDTFHYDYLYPTGNSTDAVRIYTSTPWKSSGFFYRMVDPENTQPANEAVVIAFTIDAIALENPNYYETVMKTVNQLKIDGKNNEVQRAYYCRFVKGESSYFAPDDVINSFANKGVEKFATLKNPCDMGVDFGGQVKSKTVITVTEFAEDGNVYRRYCKTYEVGKDTELVDDIERIKHSFNVQRIVVDDCAAGVHFIRQMEEKGWDVFPMSFRADKVKKYGAFRVWLKRGKIFSYADSDLQTEMLELEFTPGARQSNIQHAPGGSDDLIDSFLMSTYFFIDEETGMKFFQW